MHIRKHTVFPKEFPEAWASDWGQDEYGLWMAFTYKGVRQAFRWCEPGTFLMGSPRNEPERHHSELQHEVTLTKGFWIADTPVTQSLWKVIMGENPSRFSGEERPVTNLSWDDVQAFVAKMNRLKAELKLCLPTEAQWEYACRAGTASPFFWGDQIDSTLVNFNGNIPYNNGQRSENRGQTVEVKALPCNNWGVYQMHGNVLEWCQDWHGEFASGAVSDPKGLVSGDWRVLRGGAWSSGAHSCRSAKRSKARHLQPSDHYVNAGFRLARDH